MENNLDNNGDGGFHPQNLEVFNFWVEILAEPTMPIDIFWRKVAYAKDKLKQYAIPLNTTQEQAQEEWEETIYFLEEFTKNKDFSNGTHVMFCVTPLN